MGGARILQLTIRLNPLIWYDRLAKRDLPSETSSSSSSSLNCRCMGVANGFRQSMGGEWAEQRKLSKFIVDWENGTRAACNNCANRAGNVHELCTGISP